MFRTTPILTRHRAIKQNSQFSWLKRILLSIRILVFVTVLAVLTFFIWVIKDLPKISNIDEIIFAQSSVIYDRNGEELYTIHGDENRTIVPIEKIPYDLIDATLAIEDASFFEHHGFSVKGYIRAIFSEIINFGAHKSGGSTITQQFIKNTFLNSEKTYIRKIKELILSMQLELKFTKEGILALYLNSIPYGSNAYGVGQASLSFFGKPVEQLSLAESTVLAALPKAPSFYSPHGSHVHTTANFTEEELKEVNAQTYPEFLTAVGESSITIGLLPTKIVLNNGAEIIMPGRASLVLNRLFEIGSIDENEKIEAEKQLLNLSFKTYHTEINAPHFVMYVRDLLEEKYGKEFVAAGGLKIYTTLDYKLQQKAEEIVKSQVEKNEKSYEATNASLMSVRPKTGEILVMVGSRDYWDEVHDGKVNVNLQRRLLGSSFKPFAYATAFLAGYAPATVVFDLETDFGNGYKPKNFSGTFMGPVSFRKALGNSLNIPAIKAGILGGLQRTYDLAKGMGITFLKEADWYGAALPLGVAEIRPIDMAQAYAVFANLGEKVELTPFLKIVDRNGNILDAISPPQGKQVLDKETAYLITNILSDPKARGPGWNNSLQLPGRVNAVKTGTSNKKKGNNVVPLDGWTIGYTPDLVTVVWTGNNNGTPMSTRASGFGVAVPIWRTFMIEALKDTENKEFEKPAGIKSVLVSSLTGKLPTSTFPRSLIVSDIFSSLDIPTQYDDSLKIITVDRISGNLPNEFTPEDAKKEIAIIRWSSERPSDPNWERPVRNWVKNNGANFLKGLGVDEVLAEAPLNTETIHTRQNTQEKPEISITSPIAFGEVSKNGVGVWVDVRSKYGISLVEFFLNDTLMDTQKAPLYKGNITFPKTANVGDEFEIKAKVYDILYNTSIASIQVKVAKDEQPPKTEIVFPSNGDVFAAGSVISVQTYTYDARSDIAKVIFYLNDEKYATVDKSPYSSNLQLPDVTGEYKIKVIAYDGAANTAENEIKIKVESKKTAESLKVETLEKISFGSSSRISFFVPVEDVNEIKTVQLIARFKVEDGVKPEDLVLTEVTEFTENSNGIFEYLWIRPQLGSYEVFAKAVYKNGKVLFSAKNKVEVF